MSLPRSDDNSLDTPIHKALLSINHNFIINITFHSGGGTALDKCVVKFLFSVLKDLARLSQHRKTLLDLLNIGAWEEALFPPHLARPPPALI